MKEKRTIKTVKDFAREDLEFIYNLILENSNIKTGEIYEILKEKFNMEMKMNAFYTFIHRLKNNFEVYEKLESCYNKIKDKINENIEQTTLAIKKLSRNENCKDNAILVYLANNLSNLTKIKNILNDEIFEAKNEAINKILSKK